MEGIFVKGHFDGNRVEGHSVGNFEGDVDGLFVGRKVDGKRVDGNLVGCLVSLNLLGC